MILCIERPSSPEPRRFCLQVLVCLQIFGFALTGQGQTDRVSQLISDLKSAKPENRESAALALSNADDPRAVDPLISALSDDDWRVRESAVKGLRHLGDIAVSPLVAYMRGQGDKLTPKHVVGLLMLADMAGDKPEYEDVRKNLLKTAVNEYLIAVTQAAEAGAKSLEDATARKRLAAMVGVPPESLDKGAVYWLTESVQPPGVFSLKKKVSCLAPEGVFLAEMMVPCGSVFVNHEGQIGGRIYSIP